MAVKSSLVQEVDKRTLVINRTFHAPKKLVFSVWADMEHYTKWIGPKDYICTFCEMDVRPGGKYRTGIKSPEGVEYIMSGVYHDVTPYDRLSFTFGWDNKVQEQRHETLVTITFHETAGVTHMTFQQAAFRTEFECQDHRTGWSESFDRLAEYVEKA